MSVFEAKQPSVEQFEGQNIGQGENVQKKTRFQQEDSLEIAGNETHDDE